MILDPNRVTRSLSNVAIPPTSYRAPELEFNRTAEGLPGELPGKLGCWGGAGGTAAETAGRIALAFEEQRNESLPSNLCSGSPSTPPSTPSFPGGSFPRKLHSNFGKFQLGGPVAGRRSRDSNGFPPVLHAGGMLSTWDVQGVNSTNS